MLLIKYNNINVKILIINFYLIIIYIKKII